MRWKSVLERNRARAIAAYLFSGLAVSVGASTAMAGQTNLPGSCTSAPTGYTVTYGNLVCIEMRYVCRDEGYTLVVYSMECTGSTDYDGSTFIQTP